MIIAVVTETYWPEVNGVAMTLFRLVTGLAKLGHDIQLVCPHRKERNVSALPGNIFYLPVKGVPIPGYREAKFGLHAPRKLKQLWHAERPDVIYVATEGPLGWSSIKSANKIGIPVVSGFHTNFHSYSQHYSLGFLKKLIGRYLVNLHNKTHATITPTDEQKSLLTTMGIKNIAVMGRGVDTRLFSPAKRSSALRRQWGVENNEPVMIYVGRIAEEKNLALTIQTYFALRELNDKLKFVLVGDGPLAPKLRKDYPEFIMAGTQTGEDLATHFASGDIFAFTSLTETFGNVILEAMASGLAIVAYDYAAAHLHIDPGGNGLLAELNDPQDFLQQAKCLIQNDVLLKKLRLNAGRDALQHSWESIVGQFENILHSHTSAYHTEWKPELQATRQSH
jgi:glycosyltransferase involved in cell wall biosynthesis